MHAGQARREGAQAGRGRDRCVRARCQPLPCLGIPPSALSSAASNPLKPALPPSPPAADYAKMLLLTLPPALIVGGGLIGADMALGAPLMKIGGTTGVIIWCGIIMPSVYCIAASISQAIFTNGKILKVRRGPEGRGGGGRAGALLKSAPAGVLCCGRAVWVSEAACVFSTSSLPAPASPAHATGRPRVAAVFPPQAACPNCGEENLTYFGDILTVAGPRDKSLVSPAALFASHCACCSARWRAPSARPGRPHLALAAPCPQLPSAAHRSPRWLPASSLPLPVRSSARAASPS